MEIYEILWRLANDLLGKVRHENDPLGHMRQQELLDVSCHFSLTLLVVQEDVLHVEGVHYRDVRGILYAYLVRQTERNQADNGWLERLHVVHPEDVIKSHDEHVHGACSDKA